MANFVISFLLLLYPVSSKTESFEGVINLVQESYYDTTYFTYYVKDENVRIDKFDNDHQIIQSLLIYIPKQEIYILSPSKKLYTKSEVTKEADYSDKNFIITKSENHREINGITCYQWRVKNVERNTEVAYWVSQKDFYFFEDLIKLINRTEKTFEFFEKIPETQGFFPMLSVERTLLRKEKSRISVINITNKEISNSIFSIPSDYELVSK